MTAIFRLDTPRLAGRVPRKGRIETSGAALDEQIYR
jgi:hypothetical protein